MTVRKAELHCHIEGAAPPSLVRRLADRYDMDVGDLFDDTGGYRWHDFPSFLDAYGKVSSVFRSREDFRDLAREYFISIADEGAIYGEVFIAPDIAAQHGASFDDYVAGLGDGIAEAEAATGIVGRMIVVGIRHLGPEQVRTIIRTACVSPRPYLTGIGLAGDETLHHCRDFAEAFALARDAGLGITAHAGELDGPDSIRAALDHLGVKRLGHGVRAIEDPTLVERLAREEIVLELCPSSNIALGFYPDVAHHPFRRLMEAGVRVTINSDDPPFFHTSIGHEYDLLAEHQGLTEADLTAATRTAIEAAFVDETTRERLLAKLT